VDILKMFRGSIYAPSFVFNYNIHPLPPCPPMLAVSMNGVAGSRRKNEVVGVFHLPLWPLIYII